jgi:Zn-dependent peptidase ImmA (M78 family)
MGHSDRNIRHQAERLLVSAGITHEPVSLRDVVSALNLEVVQTSREPFMSEAALEPMGDSYAIVLHGDTGERRRRFTIAHEIGHFVLHPGRPHMERGGLVSEAGRLEEREADAFAAEILMPEPLVRQAVYEHGPDVARLADRFLVSKKAMQLRLRFLGLSHGSWG